MPTLCASLCCGLLKACLLYAHMAWGQRVVACCCLLPAACLQGPAAHGTSSALACVCAAEWLLEWCGACPAGLVVADGRPDSGPAQ